MPPTDAKLLEVLAELAAPRTLPELRAQSLELITELVSCSWATWNEIDAAAGRFDVVVYPEPPIDPGPPSQRMLSLLHEHPVIAYTQATGDGRPHAISDFVDEETFRTSALYREVYAPLNVVDQLSFSLPDPHLLIGVALNRPRTGFTQAERRVLNLLRPHFVHAHRNALAFERLTRALQAQERRSSSSGEYMVLLDRDRRVEYSSPGAEEVLSDWFRQATGGNGGSGGNGGFGANGGSGGNGGLPQALSESLSQSSVDAPQTSVVLSRDGQTLTVELVGLPEGTGEALLMSQRPSVPARLRDLGLSPRQIEVLTLAAEGLRNAAIAAELAISPRTVEKHLQQTYEQLGTSGRVAAVRLVHRIAGPPH